MPEAKKARTKREREAAGALLVVRDDVLARLKRATQSVVSQEDGERRVKRAALLALLLMTGRKLGSELSDVLSTGRKRARLAARGRLAKELKATTGQGRTFGTRGDAVDAAAGAIAGESLAVQWRGIVIGQAYALAEDAGISLATVGQSRKLFLPRLERSASTEVARAYNEEHRAALREVARQDPELCARLQREWCAMVDSCERCWPHDGERVDIDEHFAGGDEPGSMHPRCMCIATVVAI